MFYFPSVHFAGFYFNFYVLEDTTTSKMFTNLSCVTSSFSVFIDRTTFIRYLINPLNAELNPICHLLALLGAHPILHISRIRVKLQEL